MDPTSATAFRSSGRWPDVTICDALEQRCRQTPNAVAVIGGSAILSFSDLKKRSQAVASILADMGVGEGDVVSMQLPNWHEAIILVLATAMVGAIINPIVPIYRDAEVAFILNDAKPRAFFLPRQFRSFDYAAMAERLAPAAKVVTVRGSSGTGFDFGVAHDDHGGSVHAKRLDPDAVRLLMYTSGTTGRAKGVLHSSNTLAAEISAVTEYWNVTADDVVLMPSPLTHITGFLYGIELPIRTGAKVVLMDRWLPDEAVRLIERHGVTMTVSATPFLAELAAEAQKSGTGLPSLRLFACGGAPVAPDLVYRAFSTLENCIVTRVYGSTEAPTVTLGVASRAEKSLAAETEGRVVGHEAKLVDPSDAEVPPGAEGEILTRGPELFLGYSNPSDNDPAFTQDGYFRTGDLGRFTPEGMLVITGRKKDLIIRGGENIAPKEIEDVLCRFPDVAEAAVVAIPSDRLGEGVGAFVVPRPGAALGPEVLEQHVSISGLARQKWPVRYFFVDELPKTAAGKVRKDILRNRAAL